jgi:sugar/nucleoside kinase (ribokinase family)
MRDKTQQSGGSAANSAYGLAALGGSAAFAGQVCRDAVGDAFIADLVAGGVSFVGQQKEGGLATARSMIFVTPDGVRSMNTYLGTSLNLTANHIPADTGASVIYLEGYLFDAPEGPEIFKKAAEIAQQSDAQLALSLSDPWCVERHHEQFSAFIREHVSILFSNEEEVTTLTGSDRIAAQQEMSAQLDELIITQGADGAVVCCEDAQVSVPAMPEGAVIDTTGAGDLFAAGYLYGRATGASALQSAELASLCAGEVICHYGARPAKPIAAFIEQAV